MLTKITALTFVGVVASAQQFLGSEKPYEIYRVSKQPALSQEVVDINATLPLEAIDLQFKCQYMAGLNFYNLQDLNK